MSNIARIGGMLCVPNIAVANLEQVQTEQDTEVRMNERSNALSQSLGSLPEKVLRTASTGF